MQMNAHARDMNQIKKSRKRSGGRRAGRINVKALIILTVVLGLLVIGAVGTHFVRKRVMANRAYSEGQSALAKGDLAEACLQFKRYLWQYPDDIATLEVYGESNLLVRPRTQENVAAAIAAYRRLLRHKPGEGKLYERLSHLYLMARDHEQAERVCRQRLEDDPSDSGATLMLAKALMGQQRWDDALAILESLIEHHADVVEAYALKASVVLRQDSSDEAVKKAEALLDRAIELWPESALAYIQRARLRRDGLSGRKPRDTEAALADLERALALNPKKSAEMLDLAYEYAVLQRSEQANAILDRIDIDEMQDHPSIDVDTDKFLLDWYLVKGSVVRQMGALEEMSRIAHEGLENLQGGYRSAFLENAIDLLLTAREVEPANLAIADYREVVTGLRQGSVAGDEMLSIFMSRLALLDDRPFDSIDLLEPVVAVNPSNFTAWRLLGQAFVITRQPRRTIRALEKCLEIRPGELTTIMQLVKEYIRAQAWGKAVNLARSLGRDSLDASLLRIEASMRGAMEREVSREVLQPLAEELVALKAAHPDRSAVRMLLASLAEFTEDFASAEGELRGAIADCSDPLDAAMQLTYMLQRRNRVEEAIEVCEEAVGSSGDQARPWIRWAELLTRLDRIEEAENRLTEGGNRVADEQAKSEIALSRAKLLLRLQRRDEAIEQLTAMARLSPRDATSRIALLELPEILEEAGRAQELVNQLKQIEGERSGIQWRLHQARLWLAMDDWKQRERAIVETLGHCLDSDPDWTRPVMIVGRMYEQLNDPKRAEDAYRRLLEVHPQAIEVVDRLLRLLEEQNRVAEAKEILDRLPADLPGLTDHRVGLAAATGEFETAIRELQTQVAADPKDADSRVLLARLLYREQRDAAEAFRLLDEAAKIDPEQLAVSAVRAFILLSEDDAEQAESVLDQEVDRRRDFSSYLLRAQFHMAQERLDEAERDYLQLTKFESSVAVGFELLGRFYHAQGRLEEAVAAWDEALVHDANRTTTRRMIMKTLLSDERSANLRRGLDLLESELAAEPDHPDLLAVRARLLLRDGTEGAVAEAKSLLQRVVTLDGRAVSAHLALMQLEFAEGNIEKARSVIARALGFNPGHLDLLMAEAELERAGGDLMRAKALAQLVLERDPDRLAAYVLLTDVAFLTQDFAAAARNIEAAAERAPGNELVQIKRAAALSAQGQSQAAIDGLIEYVTRYVGVATARSHLALANLECQAGDLASFEERLRHVEANWPGSAEAVRTRIQCLISQNRFPDILPLLSTRRAEFPDDADTLVIGANALARSGAATLQREAQMYLETAIERSPMHLGAVMSLAQISYILEDKVQAKEMYRRALELDPLQPQALNDLAWILSVDDNQVLEGLELADRGVLHHPDDPHLRDTRGVALTKADRLAEAERELLLAVELADARDVHSTHARAYLHLADVYERRGDLVSQQANLQLAKSVDEEHDVFDADERQDLDARLAKF